MSAFNTDTNFGFGSGVPSATSPSIYNGTSPTTCAVGGIACGSPIAGCSYDNLFQSMLVPFLQPFFASFDISGQSASVEVGTCIAGTKSFEWSFANPQNVCSGNLMNICDLSTPALLATGCSNTSPASVAICTFWCCSNSQSAQWCANTKNCQNNAFNSSAFTVTWRLPFLYGYDAANNISGTTLYDNLSAIGKQIIGKPSSIAITYNFTNKYQYFTYPAAYGDLTKVLDPNGFDVTTAFTKSVVSVTSTGIAANWTANYNSYVSNTLTTVSPSGVFTFYF